MKIVNQLLKFFARMRGDMPSRIAMCIFTAGVLTFGGGLICSFQISHTQADGTTTSFAADFGSAGFVAYASGFILVVIGLGMLIRRYRILINFDRSNPIPLFFFCGFTNMNPQIPTYAVSKLDSYRIQAVKTSQVDSYDPIAVAKDYSYHARIVRERVNHDNAKKAYFAGLGSVPYLYAMGTLFAGGNISLTALEHDRSEDQWHMLDDVGLSPKLLISYNGLSDVDEILQACANSEAIGLAISFSAEIQLSELPQQVRGNTISLKLSSGLRYDALSVAPVQEEIVKEITHFITRLFKCGKRIDLFVAAQSSVVINLGRLYQENMMNDVFVHNFDPSSRSYNWALRINGGDEIESVVA